MATLLYVTLSAGRRKVLHPAPAVYYKKRGNLLIPSSVGDPDTLVYNPATGRAVAQKTLLKGGQIIVPPAPVINWQSPPTIPGGSGDFMIPEGNYLNEDPSKALFTMKYQSSSPGRIIATNSRLRSAGPIFGGFRGAVRAENCLLDMIPPTADGATPPRLVVGEEIFDLYFDRITVPYTGRGIYLTGLGSPKAFAGSVASGQGVVITRSKFRNVDGWIRGRKSNWTPTKNGSKFTASGAQYGAQVANLIQFNGMPKTYILLRWVELLNDLGTWGEDMISMFGGSGGLSTQRATFEDILLHNTGARDWNYMDGTSTSTYNGGQMITQNADPGNTLDLIQWTNSGGGTENIAYSGTSHLIGDGLRTDAYDMNSAYVDMRRVTALGFRPVLSIQGGHHNVMDSCKLYATDRHFTGVPYSGPTYQNFQITDYHVGATAADNGQVIFGYNQMVNNTLYAGSGTATMSAVGDILDNNGVFSGNTRQPAVTDGGAAAIDEFRARAQTAGVTMGSTLS